MIIEPGHKRHELKEEGQRRRAKEHVRRIKKLVAEIRKKEAASLEKARLLIEERIGSYEDVPL